MQTEDNSQEIFRFLLQQFCEATITTNIDDNFSSIFLPHVMPGYWKTNIRIFYFGRDTSGWKPTTLLLQAHSKNNHLQYFDQACQWVREYGFLDYNKNKSSGFWTLVIRLHLRLKGFTENLKISDDLPEKYYEHINDFGWGNTNSIEVPKSLQNQGIWETLDKEKYWIIKEHSKPFDKLIHTIKVYKPDIVFIFNWACDEKLFLEGLNYQEFKLDLISGYFLYYFLPDTNTKIIWTVHPTAARWLGYGTDDLIDELIDFLNKETEYLKSSH